MIFFGLDGQPLQSEPTHTAYPPWTDTENHLLKEIRYVQRNTQTNKRTWGLEQPEIHGRSERINFSPEQIFWISIIDGNFCQLPSLDDNYQYCGPKFPFSIGNAVHHIIPAYYSKWFAPQDHIAAMHNTPLNGICLGNNAHALIHNTWMDSYIDTYMKYIRDLGS